MTTPDLPAPREEGATPDEHAAISRRFIQQASDELRKGDRIQASEKTWGALAHGVKAIAKERGWLHEGHHTLVSGGRHLGIEFGHPRLVLATDNADKLHRNFYNNYDDLPQIADIIDEVASVLPDLEAIRKASPRYFVIRNGTERRQVRWLTGDGGIQIGDESSVGFSLNHPDEPFQSDGGPPAGSGGWTSAPDEAA